MISIKTKQGCYFLKKIIFLKLPQELTNESIVSYE